VLGREVGFSRFQRVTEQPDNVVSIGLPDYQ
jgi:hypothetical protein